MGWTIGKNVRIGFSYICANCIDIGEDTVIGHFNIIGPLRSLQIGKGSFIANFNQFLGWRNNSTNADSFGKLVIGENVKFMSHHFIDTAGMINIGRNTVVGGRNTQFWSHSLTYETVEPKLSYLELSVGEDVYIGARSTLVSCSIPDRSVIGAGSVVTKDFPKENSRLLIAGNPARIRKRYPITASTESFNECS
ncbi:MAG: DapH/DapD/GlmU-related protein [Leptolyngbya sp. BL-A-14]